MASTRFYSDLPTHTVSISQLMGDETRFAAMPADWRVILTDVRKSTQALSEGRQPACSRPRWPARRGLARGDRPLLPSRPMMIATRD